MKSSLITRSAAVLLLVTSGSVIAGEPGFPWTTADAGPHGAPTSSHWTALIGTGHVSGPTSLGQSKSPSSPQTQRSKAEPHWTSTIGTGRAAESNDGIRAISAGHYNPARRDAKS